MGRAIVLEFLAMTIPLAMAQPREPRLSFRSSVEVPAAGLRLPAPPGAKEVGLPPTVMRTYKDGQGRLVEMQSPRDYWVSSQFLGRWESEAGLRMTLAVPMGVLPSKWPRAHILPSEYEAVMRGVAPPADAEEWKRWAETWTGSPLSEPLRALPPTTNLRAAQLFVFGGAPPLRRGLAFALRANAFGVDPQRWYFVLFEMAETAAAETLEREIIRSFLPNIAAAARPSGAIASPVQSRSPSTSATGATDADALTLSRQRALDSIRGHRDWWHTETPHYVLVSNLKGSRASAVRQIQEEIEPLRNAFAALVPPVVPIRAVSIVRVFADGDGYVQWVGQDKAWSGGMWMPDRGELVVRAREWGNAREQREWLRGTVYHEAFHQYLHYATGGRVPAAWFNEGHATFFEGAEIRDGKVIVEEELRYAAMTHKMVSEKRLAIASAFQMTYRDLYEGRAGAVRAENYARCWAIVYFLRKHAEAAPGGPFSDFHRRYLETFGRTGDNNQSLAVALGPQSMADLEAALIEFWNSPSARRAARRFDPWSAGK